MAFFTRISDSKFQWCLKIKWNIIDSSVFEMMMHSNGKSLKLFKNHIAFEITNHIAGNRVLSKLCSPFSPFPEYCFRRKNFSIAWFLTTFSLLLANNSIVMCVCSNWKQVDFSNHNLSNLTFDFEMYFYHRPPIFPTSIKSPGESDDFNGIFLAIKHLKNVKVSTAATLFPLSLSVPPHFFPFLRMNALAFFLRGEIK